ncbi:hypothetical protein BT63DRAFT_459443 [Microthyrium microscopicum]|uniref:Uncharacterized protein n=1 Tax=Microthyrium microscopicum TaxID=703497 RepID=A0A6A6TYP5_9PEZI|nr:hypothetical protein BT63DRAFT_459443 [Microthyrium microscopicum]
MASAAFSVITTGISMYPMFKAMTEPNKAEATLVKITLGSTGLNRDPGSMGGNIPHVSVYADDGVLIGRAKGNSKKNWTPGSTYPVSINPEHGQQGKQATYVTVAAAGNDAICISGISVAWPDGSDPRGWLGDMGQNCTDVGLSAAESPYWANSNTQTGSDPSHKSKCIWLDGDKTGGIATQAIGLHITDFGRTDGATDANGEPLRNAVAKQWTGNRDLFCKAKARMGFYDTFFADSFPLVYQPPLEFNDNGTDKDVGMVLHHYTNIDPELLTPARKRRNAALPSFNVTSSSHRNLVHSHHAGHSAVELCLSKTSVSPDFVSHAEGKFCDMATKIIWPLCLGQTVVGCFNATSNQLIPDATRLNKRELEQVNASADDMYSHILHW